MKPLFLSIIALAASGLLNTASAQQQTPLTSTPAAPPTQAREMPAPIVDASWTQADDAHYPDKQPKTPAHPWTTRTEIGAATATLLQAQADGTDAGAALPTLGATASRSWQRYLDSFTHPLPDQFEESVESK